MKNSSLRIGFVSTRFAGTDGVSLETEKWAVVFKKLGHSCYYFAGLCDRPAEVSYVVPNLFFHHPEMEALHEEAFNQTIRSPQLTRKIQEYKAYFKDHLQKFVKHFEIDLLVSENALSIPVNIPLGMAISEFIAETGFPVIAHHHDMYWERKRFLVNCVWDYLTMAFPPAFPSVKHVVINSVAGQQLSLRTGASCRIVPNVMDFETPPPPLDEYAQSLRKDLGLDEGEKLILQPTRVVQRKGIEHAIELVSRLDIPARLVISHAAGDEGREYEHRVRDYAKRMGVNTLFVSDIIQEKRGRTPDGRKIYTLYDVYPHADLVTYPSEIEGFGNAFLEAIYFHRPIVVNRYSIYEIDIKPKGFQVIEFDGFITEQSIQQARRALKDAEYAQEMCRVNYRVARKHYSFSVLEMHLKALLTEIYGINHAG
ncbi:glycosyltransferase [Bellilinea caldifistulae]|uniref:Glycosyl transferase family 1 n=1 Tax=Bellilinea caldifistulae TaxID=360411 RepID=A0A0P6XI96_9CHLR|nr:glycosyltransferase family 4 protein [Bellilinea caldifistulae]KPL70822.1 glycosyl transferase family 1 [Bellilinea caldifistulae]GAP10947.1 glycosyltransferase [Bellilinea caldifistulae]